MITDLLVEWVGPELRATWRGGDDPTVFVSADPDDAGTVIVPVTVPGGVRVLGLPEGFRAYVHVLDLDGRFVVGAERLIRLGRAGHAVDLGGRPAPDDQVTGWGRLYAGDPIDELDDVGLDRLSALAIRTVCDLRGALGSTGRPAWLDPDIRWELPGVGEGDAAQVAEVAALAADRANHPLLFHAGVGEDRAVVVAALVLSAVGVADADLPFFPTRAEVLADLRDQHGSVDGYLTGAGGLDRAVLDALGGALLT
jgi:hypothetical protein